MGVYVVILPLQVHLLGANSEWLIGMLTAGMLTTGISMG